MFYVFRSLTGKFIFISLLIGSFIIVYIYGSFVLTHHIRGEATRINLTGELRFRAFETAWLAHKILETEEAIKKESYRIELGHEITICDGIIKDLINGNRELNIKPLEYKEPLALLEGISIEWNKYLKPTLLKASNRETSGAEMRREIEIFDSKIHEYVYKIDEFAGLLEKDYIKELKEYDLFRLYAIGFFIIISIFTVIFLRSGIVSPIKRLTEAVMEIGKGNFGIRLEPRGKDEISILSSSFNNTAERLENLLRSLQKSEESLKRAQQIAHLGNWDWDIERNELFWSDEVYRIFGIAEKESLTYESFIEYIHPEERESVKKAIEDAINRKKPYSIDHRIIRPDGVERIVHEEGEVFFDNSGNPLRMSGTVQDITDYKKLEEQLIQAQKMEAVGQLAGGIAHDFNNLLTAIIGYASIILEDLKEDDPVAVRVNHILGAAEKASNLVQNLLTFSRKQISNPRPVDLNEIIKNILNLLKRLVKEDIEFKSELSGELIIMADSGQIEQILMNLVTNARDAMPEGGVITIETGKIMIDDLFIRTHGFGQVGEYALLSISDTGTGMDDKTKEKIFEPFFTTKETGKGTGLGMAMVYSIVKQHNGYINLYSELYKGTTFKIYFPLMGESWEKDKIEHPEEIRGGVETILLAEDDNEVRTLISGVLRSAGYTVIEAVDGEEALKRFREEQEKINLMVLDIIMPKNNGIEVYKEVKRVRSDIKAILMSGYSLSIIREKIPEDYFIPKPVRPAELLKKVREVLDRG